MGKLQEMLDAQEDLQIRMPPHRCHPSDINDIEKGAFFMTQAFSLTDEIHEAAMEISWKPWAKGQYFDRERYVGELVDAWHFFMNLMLLSGITEQELYDRYMFKRRENINRQLRGYDGRSGKCPCCHRDLLEVSVASHTKRSDYPSLTFCSPICATEYAATSNA